MPLTSQVLDNIKQELLETAEFTIDLIFENVSSAVASPAFVSAHAPPGTLFVWGERPATTKKCQNEFAPFPGDLDIIREHLVRALNAEDLADAVAGPILEPWTASFDPLLDDIASGRNNPANVRLTHPAWEDWTLHVPDQDNPFWPTENFPISQVEGIATKTEHGEWLYWHVNFQALMHLYGITQLLISARLLPTILKALLDRGIPAEELCNNLGVLQAIIRKSGPLNAKGLLENILRRTYEAAFEKGVQAISNQPKWFSNPDEIMPSPILF